MTKIDDYLHTNLHPIGKGSKHKQGIKTKSFGYQILGFGSGGAGTAVANFTYLLVAGGGGNSTSPGPGGGGGFRTHDSGGTVT